MTYIRQPYIVGTSAFQLSPSASTLLPYQVPRAAHGIIAPYSVLIADIIIYHYYQSIDNTRSISIIYTLNLVHSSFYVAGLLQAIL